MHFSPPAGVTETLIIHSESQEDLNSEGPREYFSAHVSKERNEKDKMP